MMLPTVAEALQAAGAAGPWLALALVLLGIAGRIARAARRSAVLQGQRIGELERVTNSEKTRRQQVESVLRDLGVPLPYWPPDGPLQPFDRRIFGGAASSSWSSQEDFPDSGKPRDERRPADVDEDLADEDPETAVRRIPVPPLPDELGARHRRTANR
jgi:hypothetical protein